MNPHMRDENQCITVEVRDDGTRRVRVQTINQEPTMTQQQYAAECDINNIVERHAKTGQITWLAKGEKVFADFTSLGTYHEMWCAVAKADEAFMTLPAKVRSRFGNDPGQLMEFLQDPANNDEAVKLGLKDQNKIQKPQTHTPLKNKKQPALKNDDDSNDDEK